MAGNGCYFEIQHPKAAQNEHKHSCTIEQKCRPVKFILKMIPFCSLVMIICLQEYRNTVWLQNRNVYKSYNLTLTIFLSPNTSFIIQNADQKKMF